MSKYIGLLGAGGQADEIASYAQDSYNIVFNAVTRDYLTGSDKLIDVENSEDYKKYPVIVAVGAPKIKNAMVDKWSGHYCALVSDKASVASNAKIEGGAVVAPGAIVTTNVTIGSHVLINIGATVSHDCAIGSYSTISPGVHIGGRVAIGDGVFIGIGASIKNGVKIADGVVIGAGALVLKDITEENAVYAGVPAVKIGQNEDWLEKI